MYVYGFLKVLFLFNHYAYVISVSREVFHNIIQTKKMIIFLVCVSVFSLF